MIIFTNGQNLIWNPTETVKTAIQMVDLSLIPTTPDEMFNVAYRVSKGEDCLVKLDTQTVESWPVVAGTPPTNVILISSWGDTYYITHLPAANGQKWILNTTFTADKLTHWIKKAVAASVYYEEDAFVIYYDVANNSFTWENQQEFMAKYQ